MLSFAEELYLLALDEDTGKPRLNARSMEMRHALTGAVLAELSFLGRIDTDLTNLFLISTEPTGQPVLDPILEIIAREAEPQSIAYWIKTFESQAREIEAFVLNQLVAKKIVAVVEDKILWIIPNRRYPLIDGQEVKDIERRLRQVILEEDLPDPRDTVLISLAHTCGFFEEILSPREYKRAYERIELLARLDSVGKEVSRMIDLMVQISGALLSMH